MGKKVIPEQVEYFCDGCNVKLTKQHHGDFTVTTNEALRDYSGAEMNERRYRYELCGKCESSFKGWLEELKNENT